MADPTHHTGMLAPKGSPPRKAGRPARPKSPPKAPPARPRAPALAAADRAAAWAAVSDPEAHADWARAVAARVAKEFFFRPASQEGEELAAVAVLAVVEMLPRFDPDRVPPGGDPVRAFRGWAARNVHTECIREARRLRNGGTYHTRQERGGPLVAAPLSDLARAARRAGSPAGYDVADPREPADPDDAPAPPPAAPPRPPRPEPAGLAEAGRALELAAHVRAVAAGPLAAHVRRLGGPDFLAHLGRVERVLADLVAFAANPPGD